MEQRSYQKEDCADSDKDNYNSPDYFNNFFRFKISHIIIMITKSKKIKRGRIKNIFFSVLFAFSIISIVAFFFYSNLRINQKRAEQLKKIEELRKEIQDVEQKNAELKSGISAAGTQDYWEEKAREQGYKKPGEEQVTIVPAAEKETQQTQTQKSFWQKVWDKINPSN